MEFIVHRVNTIKELKQIPKEYGCEIDIRTNGNKLILSHDPFTKGDDFIDYLDVYKNGTLVLNIKETGIEDIVLKEIRLRNIKSYFLLDVEFPYIYSATKKGERNIAVRFSEKEPIENVVQFKSKVDWVWIDTINKLPINTENIDILKCFNTCLVCPSRWGRPNDINKIKNGLNSLCYECNYIMTELKFITKWLN